MNFTVRSLFVRFLDLELTCLKLRRHQDSDSLNMIFQIPSFLHSGKCCPTVAQSVRLLPRFPNQLLHLSLHSRDGIGHGPDPGHRLALAVHDKLGEVPLDAGAQEAALLFFQPRPHWRRVLSVHVHLQSWKSDSSFCLVAKSFAFLGGFFCPTVQCNL